MKERSEFDTHASSALARLLTAYDAQVQSGAAAREEVSAKLRRVFGFQNSIEVGSGHTIISDEPATFGGGGSAPDPAEALLAAVAASLSVTITAHASLRNIPLQGIVIDVAGWMAADSFFRPDGGAEPGMQDLRLSVVVHSNAPRGTLDALVEDSVRASPVVSSLAKRPLVELRVEEPQ